MMLRRLLLLCCLIAQCSALVVLSPRAATLAVDSQRESMRYEAQEAFLALDELNRAVKLRSAEAAEIGRVASRRRRESERAERRSSLAAADNRARRSLQYKDEVLLRALAPFEGKELSEASAASASPGRAVC